MSRIILVLPICPLLACAGDLGDSAAYIAALEEQQAESDESSSSANTSGQLSDCAQTAPAFLRDEERCAGCHNDGPSPAGGLDLASPDLASRLANVEAICPSGLLADPADPEASTLVTWTRGGIEQCGRQAMPPVGEPLSLDELDCMITWIDGLDGVMDLSQKDVVP